MESSYTGPVLDPIVTLVLLLVAVGAYLLWRANEIFCLSVREGRVLVVRGRIPPALLHGIEDVVRRTGTRRATIRAVAGQHHARLAVSGTDDGTAQRLRNVFGTHPIQKLRGAKLPEARNLGQVLGIAWLAWLLVDRGRG
ncbi:Hypothetical protein I5071_13080 [Sandaracinus amylolyticus]|nr:Hypothetical protein I5071_13080 [Sandaracinus amylolyticus]